MNINWIDLIISVLFIYGSIVGYRRGLIREIASLFGLISSIVFVYHFSTKLSVLVELFLGIGETVSYIISSLIIFFTSIYFISYLAKLLTKALNISILGIINSLSGLIFGLLKWIIIVSSFILLINKLFFLREMNDQFKSDEIKSSIFYNPLSNFGEFIFKTFNYQDKKEDWKYL